MKKVLITWTTFLSLGMASAQNTFPAVGDVNINGGLTVGLPATFNGDLIANRRANFIDGTFSGTVYAHELSVDSLTTLNGRLRMIAVPNFTNPAGTSVLFLDNEGIVRKIGATDFLDKFSTGMYTMAQCHTDANGDVVSPLWNNGTNKIYTACADVGIGTNTPLFELDVRGTGFFNNGIRIGTTTASSQTASNQALLEVETTNNSKPFIRFSHKSGTNPPETRFRVENDGSVYCTSVKVRWPGSIPVPDYVFKPDYQLMPLEDLKAFIVQNSHLPNVPSEAEIKREGLNMEQMQMQLLEKVEELTLYVIKLDEGKRELERQNALLVQEMEALKSAISKSK